METIYVDMDVSSDISPFFQPLFVRIHEAMRFVS